MFEVQKAAVLKAIRTLEAVKNEVQFAIEFDGKTYGNQKLMPANAKVTPRYKRGETRKHYAPYFKGAQIGDVIQIPFAGFDPTVLAANISAACVHTFGKGNCTSYRNNKTNCIEVMILDQDESIPHKYRMDILGERAVNEDEG